MINVQEIRKIVQEKCADNLVVPEHDHTGHHYRYLKTNKVYDSVTTLNGILESKRLKRWSANMAVQYIDRNWNIINKDNKNDHYKAAVLAHEDVLHDAGDIGTQGHKVVEKYLLKWIETDRKPEDIRKFIVGTDSRLWAITRSAEMFINDFEIIPIAAEINVASEKYEYAGQLDCLAILIKETKQGSKAFCKHNYGKFRSKYWKCSECGRIVEPVFSIVDWKTSNSIDKPEYAMQVAAYYQAFYEMTRLRPKEIVIVQLDKYKAKYKVVRVNNRPQAFRTFAHVAKVYKWLNDGVTKLYPYTPKKDIFFDK